MGEDDDLLLVQELPLAGILEWLVPVLVLGTNPRVGGALLVQASKFVLGSWLSHVAVVSGLFQQACPALGSVFGGHAFGAEMSCEGDVVPVVEVHLSPAWAVGWVGPLVVVV